MRNHDYNFRFLDKIIVTIELMNTNEKIIVKDITSKDVQPRLLMDFTCFSYIS